MTEFVVNIDELGLIYPALDQGTMQDILNAWDQGTNTFLLPFYDHHTEEMQVAIATHSGVFNRHCHVPKGSSPTEIKDMIEYNTQLRSFITDVYGWDVSDPYYPTDEAIKSMEQGY